MVWDPHPHPLIDLYGGQLQIYIKLIPYLKLLHLTVTHKRCNYPLIRPIALTMMFNSRFHPVLKTFCSNRK